MGRCLCAGETQHRIPWLFFFASGTTDDGHVASASWVRHGRHFGIVHFDLFFSCNGSSSGSVGTPFSRCPFCKLFYGSIQPEPSAGPLGISGRLWQVLTDICSDLSVGEDCGGGWRLARAVHCCFAVFRMHNFEGCAGLFCEEPAVCRRISKDVEG